MRPFPFAASKSTVFGIVASILSTCGHIPQRDGRWRDGHAGEGVLREVGMEAGLGEGERT